MAKAYFTIEEMIASNTAKAKKIDNTPSEEVKKHLNELIVFMSAIREALGKPINVTSGYRCPALNKAVGGSATSAHVVGYGCDVQVKGMSNKELACFVQGFLIGKGLAWDQLLIEKSGATEWLHIGYKNQQGQQRKQMFSIIK